MNNLIIPTEGEHKIMQPRPFRFGIIVLGAGSKEEWRAKARQVEDLGYAVLLVPDHLGSQLDVFNQFAPVPALVEAADATSSIRLGSFVFDNDFRHPVMLAKEAATLDVLSGGRFELGIGAGWVPAEYQQIGLPFDRGEVRTSRLQEAIQVIKGYFAQEPLTFSGTYYKVDHLTGYPKPLQRPHPPLLIGASGKRMLSLAAREANSISLGPKLIPGKDMMDLTDVGPEALTRKLSWIREAAGDRFAEIEISTLVYKVIVTEHRQQVAASLASRLDVTPQQVLDAPFFLMGTIDEIIEDVLRLREQYGISYLSIFESDREIFAPIVAQLAGK
jgi:probable F420-dependent oxidoreductase